MREVPGRHRDRQRRGATGILVALGLLVAVGVTIAAVTTPLLDDGPTTAADLTAAETSPEAPETREVPSPAPTTASGSPSESTVSRARTRTAPKPQRVMQAKEVRRKPPSVLKRERVLAARAEAAALPVTLRIATFNVLGSQHTAPGGERRNFPVASWRTPQAVALIRKHDVDVVGLQELQADQLNGITAGTGFAAYPGYAFGEKETDNSIIYDPSRFEFVDGSSFTITFMGRPRPQTILKLRERTTGREMYFVNMHVSAGGGPNARTRAAAHNTAIAIVNDLRATGLPVFLTGDMNDRGAFFCRVLPPTGMVASAGGSTAGGCAPPGRMQVDWVVGSSDVTFADQWVDGTPQARKISDHFFISATATIAPAD